MCKVTITHHTPCGCTIDIYAQTCTHYRTHSNQCSDHQKTYKTVDHLCAGCTWEQFYRKEEWILRRKEGEKRVKRRATAQMKKHAQSERPARDGSHLESEKEGAAAEDGADGDEVRGEDVDVDVEGGESNKENLQ